MYQRTLKAITALAVLGLTAGQSMAATVGLTEVNPIDTNGAPTIDLQLVGTDFAAPGVDGGNFTFSWDPAVLQYTATTVASPPWDADAIVSDGNAASGVVDFVFTTYTPSGGLFPNFDIATISFNVIGAVGSSTSITFADSAFGGFVSPGAVPVAVTYVNGLVNVTASAVPVPAAVWLFGTGLLGLAGLAKRKKAA